MPKTNFALSLDLAPSSKMSEETNEKPEGKTILPFVCRLESYKTKFKNLHWSAANDMIHKRVDEFLDALDSFQDEVAENGQGTIGQFGPNDLTTTHLGFTTPLEAIEALNKETIAFHEEMCESDEFIGIVNSIEGFLMTLKRYVYLFRICS